MPIPHCFDYNSFAISFEIKKCETYNFVVFVSKILPSIPSPLKFHVYFKVDFYSYRKRHWDFNRQCIKCYIFILLSS